MYNEEQKLRFINELTDKRSVAYGYEKVFDKVEKYEADKDSDISTWTMEEINPVLSEIIGIRITRTEFNIRSLSRYGTWCLENRTPGARKDLSEIKPADMTTNKIKTRLVSNPQHLQRYLDYVLEPEDSNGVSNIYRAFFWLIYSGMDEEDTMNLTAENIKLDEMVAVYDGSVYPLYRESLKCLSNCVKSQEFFYKRNRSDETPGRLRERAEGDWILRGFVEGQTLASLRNEMCKKGKSKVYAPVVPDEGIMELKLTPYRVWISGVFYRMYEGERAGIPVDFEPLALMTMRSRPDTQQTRKKLTDTTRGYRRDYQRWKDAYSI